MGGVFIPYAAWVAYATFLTYTIRMLNTEEPEAAGVP
jgi:tryptophan-rich sensory protein